MSEFSALLPMATLLVAAALILVSPKALIGLISILAPLVSAWFAWQTLAVGDTPGFLVMDYSVMAVRVDALAQGMVGLFLLVAFIGAVFIHPIKDRLQHAALLTYLAGGIGVVLASDWIGFFISFEIIALSGAALVLTGREEASVQAGIRYLLFQIAAGVTVLAGILLHASQTGDWSVGPIGLEGLAAWLLFLGFGVKVGFPLVHIWLVDAYPRASIAGLAVLVAVTTKVGLIALMRVFPGEAILVPVGVVMALWPIAYVLTENNLRRVLAYSMMIQLGLMVVAIGVGTPTAMDGVALHIGMDVLFKMTMFMAMALIFAQYQTTNADQLGGLAKHWPIVAVCVAIAALANIALPFTGAFLSKKLMLGAIQDSTLPLSLYWLLVSLSVVGLLYAWIRVFWRVFFGAEQGAVSNQKPSAIPATQLLALIIPVALLVLSGIFPSTVDGFRPFGSSTEVFTSKTIIAQFFMLIGAGVVYWLLSRIGFGLPRQYKTRLYDVDVVYRMVLVTMPLAVAALWRQCAQVISMPILRIGKFVAQPKWALDHLGQSWPIGAMAFWVGVLFLLILGFGLFQA